MKLEEAIEKLKKIITAKNSSDYEIALFDFGEDGSKTVLYALENSIPRKKIKEKIEELKKEGNYKTDDNLTGRVHFINEPCDYKLQALQELLEDKNASITN